MRLGLRLAIVTVADVRRARAITGSSTSAHTNTGSCSNAGSDARANTGAHSESIARAVEPGDDHVERCQSIAHHDDGGVAGDVYEQRCDRA